MGHNLATPDIPPMTVYLAGIATLLVAAFVTGWGIGFVSRRLLTRSAADAAPVRTRTSAHAETPVTAKVLIRTTPAQILAASLDLAALAAMPKLDEPLPPVQPTRPPVPTGVPALRLVHGPNSSRQKVRA